MHFGLSLSGGSACGLANIGVLRVLKRHGCIPDCIAGSSMGAIVGGVYALGIPLERIEQIALRIRLRKMVRLTNAALRMGLHGGFLKPDIAKVLRPIVGNACIGDCRIPFVCIAGRVESAVPWHQIVRPGFTERFLAIVKPHVFSPNTPLIDALLASSAIPTIFSPVSIAGATFIDLCNFGAIPAPFLRERCAPDVVVATDTTSNAFDWLWPTLPKSWKEFIRAGQKAVQRNLKAADIVIRPRIPEGQQFRFDRAKEWIDAGEEAAEGKAVSIRRKLHALDDGN